MAIEECSTGKIRHQTELAARKQLLHCWATKRAERSFYKCEECGDYHLTRRPPDNSGFRKV